MSGTGEGHSRTFADMHKGCARKGAKAIEGHSRTWRRVAEQEGVRRPLWLGERLRPATPHVDVRGAAVVVLVTLVAAPCAHGTWGGACAYCITT